MFTGTLALSLTFLAGFGITALLTYLIIRLAIQRGVIDVPNERSSHMLPVPRGGGASIVISFAIFLVAFFVYGDAPFDAAVLNSLLAGGIIVASIGLVDDVRHVPARWRFLGHVIAALLALFLLPSFPTFDVFGFSINLGLFGFVFFAFALVWLVNLFNFMDGIDGIAGVETISALTGAMLILALQGQTEWLGVLGFLAACVLGFLVWNWPPAKVFMGDVCSGYLGMTLGLLAIVTTLDGGMTLWAWLILLGVFVADATTTLIRRALGGESWHKAHHGHAYQILSRYYRSHTRVSISVLIINVFWLLPLAYLATAYPYWGWSICLVAWLPLFVVAIRVGAGRTDRALA